MRRLAYAGMLVSLAGVALDFASGYTLASMGADAMMGGMNGIAYIVLLYALGIAVVVTGLLLVVPGISGNMGRLGLLMELFGVVMALASTFGPGMSAALSDGMLIVGALMILNGAAMQMRKKGEMGTQAEAR